MSTEYRSSTKRSRRAISRREAVRRGLLGAGGLLLGSRWPATGELLRRRPRR